MYIILGNSYSINGTPYVKRMIAYYKIYVHMKYSVISFLGINVLDYLLLYICKYV